uniref:Apolipoprotein M n=1 Tax=Dicentrarchus labrax TaxID=13489 RepID=A0A8C4EH70_DICLA
NPQVEKGTLLRYFLYLSVSHSAPPSCEELVRPLDQPDFRHLQGRWALVAGSLSHLPYLERFKERDSATVNFSSNTSDTNISYTRTIRLDNKCQGNSYNISLEGSSFTYDGTDRSNLSANFVYTSCHDCLLMRMNVESGKRQHFYLFSRRRALDQNEMEEFRAQVKCLNMPPPVVMDPTKELCPEKTTRVTERTERH